MDNLELQVSIDELGERRALEIGLTPLRKGIAALVPTGDDAALVPVADGRFVITTDTMFEGSDFLLSWSSPFDLGWKAIATNAADVAAMGAEPIAFTVALGLPASEPVGWLYEFAQGLQASIDYFCPQAEVVGGDLAGSASVVISITATGHLNGRQPVLRSGAKAGDLVAVAGTLGKAAAGLSLLRHGDQQLIEAYRDFVDIQLRPQPPIAMGQVAADAGATAMLDVSDGLLLDADRVGRASKVWVDLDAVQLEGYQAILELAAQSLLQPDLSVDWTLRGGEDHALLATFPQHQPLPRGFKRIGEVRPLPDSESVGGVRLIQNGEAQTVARLGLSEALGWDSVSRAGLDLA